MNQQLSIFSPSEIEAIRARLRAAKTTAEIEQIVLAALLERVARMITDAVAEEIARAITRPEFSSGGAIQNVNNAPRE